MIWDLDKYSSKTAVITGTGKYISYARLSELTKELADVVNRRCLVFCLCSNTLGSLVGYVSFLNHGIVPLMLDAHIAPDLLKQFITAYRPDYIWGPKELSTVLSGEKVYESCAYTLIKHGNENVYPMYEELALLLTTSGSTGSPKFVRQSLSNIKANTKSIIKYLKLDSTERPITTLPMNYTYGLSIINTHLFVGATIILTQASLMQREFWTQFNEHKATSFGGVPYTYEILDKLMFFRRNLPSLRMMTQAGGKMMPELQRKFAEYAKRENKKFVVMYGAAEATARMAYLPVEKSLEKYGSIGIEIPGGKFQLVDDNGAEITTPDTVGELVYSGANVTLGYALCGEDLAKGDENKGTLKTGDIAKFDSDHFYYVVGRRKRFLKIFGNRVGLDETEQLIKHYFNGLECACAGKDDLMYVFISDAAKTGKIKNFLAEKTHLNQAAFHVIALDTIPKNEAGKTLYGELEKFYD